MLRSALEKPRLAVASDQTKLSGPTILNVSISIEKYSLTRYLLRVATSCFIL